MSNLTNVLHCVLNWQWAANVHCHMLSLNKIRVQVAQLIARQTYAKENSHQRQTHTASSISGVEDGVPSMFSREEVGRLLADRDRRHDEEKAERESKMAHYDSYFQQIFTMLRVPKPPMQAQTNSSRSEQGVLGNWPTIQTQPNNSGAEQVVAGHLPTFQALPFSMQPNHGGSFQALLSQAPLGNDEIAGGGVVNGGAIYL